MFKPNLTSIKIKVHPDLVVEAKKFIDKVGGRHFVKGVTLGMIQAETSFTSKNWLRHGIAGITSSSPVGSKPSDQKANITQDYVDESYIVERPGGAFNFVAFPTSVGAGDDCIPASAVASYLVNKTVRRLKAKNMANGSYNARTELAKTIGIYVTGSENARPDLHASTIYKQTNWRIKNS